MTQQEMTFSVDLDDAIAALERDLRVDGGPRISTIRTYNFAILPYEPADEFKLRDKIHSLSCRLSDAGWAVRSIALQHLLFERLRAEGPELVETLVETEKRHHRKAIARTGNAAEPEPVAALDYLKEHLGALIEGEGGLAADVEREISALCEANPDKADRMVVFIGRAGALYPFFRTSALLRHLDGRTRNVPVVLLYPGQRVDVTALKFMGELDADRDYRPRIYP